MNNHYRQCVCRQCRTISCALLNTIGRKFLEKNKLDGNRLPSTTVTLSHLLNREEWPLTLHLPSFQYDEKIDNPSKNFVYLLTKSIHKSLLNIFLSFNHLTIIFYRKMCCYIGSN
jgi:hypothetical protein